MRNGPRTPVALSPPSSTEHTAPEVKWHGLLTLPAMKNSPFLYAVFQREMVQLSSATNLTEILRLAVNGAATGPSGNFWLSDVSRGIMWAPSPTARVQPLPVYVPVESLSEKELQGLGIPKGKASEDRCLWTNKADPDLIRYSRLTTCAEIQLKMKQCYWKNFFFFTSKQMPLRF